MTLLALLLTISVGNWYVRGMRCVSPAQHWVLAWLRRLGALAIVVCLAISPSVWAIDSARTAVTLVQQAAKAYESGDFVKAADLYQKAWRLDPSPAYLWALARSEHLAGENESAIEHYRAFVAQPGAESARVGKAQVYLAEVEQEVNRTRLREADAAARAGNPTLASELYLQAYKTAPGRYDWLFKAAVAAQMAEAWEPALQHFDTYLTLAPPNAEERGQAQARDAWLRQKLGLKPMQVAEKPVAAPDVQRQDGAVKPTEGPKVIAPSVPVDLTGVTRPWEPRASTAPSWPGWTAMGGGAAFVIGGVVVLALAQADAAALAKDQSHEAGQLITTISREEAANRASAINTRAAFGWTATGLGLAASGFGVWWLTRHPEQAAVVLPTANGAQLAVRF